MEREGQTGVTENAQRMAELIRDKVGVRWPAGHVEIALIELQRRRQRRQVRWVGLGLGVGGLALVLGLGLASRPHATRDFLSQHQFLPTLASPPAAAGLRLDPGVSPARAVATTPEARTASVATGTPNASGSAPAEAMAPVREGHLLQQRLVPRRQVAAARWVALAGEKRFGEAYGLLRQVPLRELADPDDLLLAADVARQAGRPERAVPFLDRVVKEHPHELCAQLAGFSLGKVYLDNLDEPVEAANRFAAVRAMAPSGGLAQDALAREVEAWARAGISESARAGAIEYVRLYPHGRRLAAVRDLGRI
jgi:hypothetical protein